MQGRGAKNTALRGTRSMVSSTSTKEYEPTMRQSTCAENKNTRRGKQAQSVWPQNGDRIHSRYLAARRQRAFSRVYREIIAWESNAQRSSLGFERYRDARQRERPSSSPMWTTIDRCSGNNDGTRAQVPPVVPEDPKKTETFPKMGFDFRRRRAPRPPPTCRSPSDRPAHVAPC